MSFEVDTSGFGPITISENDPGNPGANDVTFGLVWPGDIASPVVSPVNFFKRQCGAKPAWYTPAGYFRGFRNPG